MSGKRTTLTLAFLTLLASSIGVALSWQKAEVLYHLHYLRAEPDYLRQIVTAPGESAQHRAIMDFLVTESGKARMFNLFLEVHERVISMVVKLSELSDSSLGYFNHGGFVAVHHHRGFDLYVHESQRNEGGQDVRASIAALLPSLAGGSFTSERNAGMVFSFGDARKVASRGPFGESVLEQLAEEFDMPPDVPAVSVRSVPR